MLDFLESLAGRADRLKAIVFWNTAVRLVSEGSHAIPKLKRLEQQGVEILAGIMCLENLELADKLAIGRPVKMAIIRDMAIDNEVITV